MNLLKRINNYESDFENGLILIEDYRYYQHELIEYFLRIIVDYISNKNKNYLTVNSIVKEDIFTYSGLSNNELMRYTVFVDNLEKETKMFFRIYVPKLLYDNFYLLNSHYYCPLLYVIDKPIIIKENSINLSSLFSSITFNIKDGIVTFIGINIILNKFVELFLINDSTVDSEELRIRLNIIKTSENNLVSYFNGIFGINCSDCEGIRKYIENLFFDEYTRYLYINCYFNEDIQTDDLSTIIKIALIMFFSGKIFNFIDLNNKRLSFIELLLMPLFKKAANIAYQASKGHLADELKIDQYIVIKNFHKSSEKKKSKKMDQIAFSGLSGKSIYDLVNLYSSLPVHKCSFMKPGMNAPPPSIANVHKTHLGRICPVTVSSIEPGRMVSIIPETYVDICGQFLGLEEA